MKKVSFVLALVILLSAFFTLFSFAAFEVTEWGAQSLNVNAVYAKLSDTDGETTVNHNFESVGFTYIYAKCSKESAYFTVSKQKKGFLGVWSEKSKSNCPHMNTYVEWGYGNASGKGTYRFELTPCDNVESNGGGIRIYGITIKEFYSKSSPDGR